MQLKIKNMVCPRCIQSVTEALVALGLRVGSVSLGSAEVEGELTPEQVQRLTSDLNRRGFELVLNPAEQAAEQVRQAVIAIVSADLPAGRIFSELLADRLGAQSPVLCRQFTQIEGRTPEQFFRLCRIERVKELIEYGELTMKEIAWRTGFSSTAHLSRQFKQMTGITTTEYRLSSNRNRRGYDEI